MSNARQFKSRIMFAFVVTILVFSMFAESSVSQSPDERPKTYIIPMEDWTRNDDVNAIRLVNMLLEEEVPVYWALDQFTVGGTTYPAGTFYIKTPFSTRLDISSD